LKYRKRTERIPYARSKCGKACSTVSFDWPYELIGAAG
jgi:hypothetical protein